MRLSHPPIVLYFTSSIPAFSRKKYLFSYITIILFLCGACAHTIQPPAPFQKDNITFVAQKKDFDRLLKSGSEYLIVCFTEKHCNSCIKYAHAFKKAAAVLSGHDKISFVAFNTFHDISSAKQYGVKGIPTTVILKKGKKIETLPGVIEEKELIRKIKTTIGLKK